MSHLHSKPDRATNPRARVTGVAFYHLFILSHHLLSYHPIIVSSYGITFSSKHPIILSAYHPIILSPYHPTLSSYPIILSSYPILSYRPIILPIILSYHPIILSSYPILSYPIHPIRSYPSFLSYCPIILPTVVPYHLIILSSYPALSYPRGPQLSNGAGAKGEGRWSVAATRSNRHQTVWPSGLRRWLQAPVRKGVGSNPTAVIFFFLSSFLPCAQVFLSM